MTKIIHETDVHDDIDVVVPKSDEKSALELTLKYIKVDEDNDVVFILNEKITRERKTILEAMDYCKAGILAVNYGKKEIMYYFPDKKQESKYLTNLIKHNLDFVGKSNV